MGADRVKVRTTTSPDRDDPRDCIDPATEQEFVPGTPASILVVNNNQAMIRNPLRSCPRRNGMFQTACTTGDFAVGDFDGDGVDDLFFGSGATWWFSSGGTAEWRFLNRKSELASSLRFGDLDADGRTDVIAFHGQDLEVSWAGASRWFPLNVLNARGFNGLGIDDVAVGQFDSDPGADLFVSNGLTYGASGTAASIRSSYSDPRTSRTSTSSWSPASKTRTKQTSRTRRANIGWCHARAPHPRWRCAPPPTA